MKANPARVKLTYDDFLLFPGRWEAARVDRRGALRDAVAEHRSIRRFRATCYFMIRIWLEQHPVGRRLLRPLRRRLHAVRRRRTRSAVSFRRPRRADPDGKHVTGAPDLVVEIGSPGTRKRDETIKRRLYERSGVSEYWVVDPDLDVVRIYRNQRRAVRAGPSSCARKLVTS